MKLNFSVLTNAFVTHEIVHVVTELHITHEIIIGILITHESNRMQSYTIIHNKCLITLFDYYRSFMKSFICHRSWNISCFALITHEIFPSLFITHNKGFICPRNRLWLTNSFMNVLKLRKSVVFDKSFTKPFISRVIVRKLVYDSRNRSLFNKMIK